MYHNGINRKGHVFARTVDRKGQPVQLDCQLELGEQRVDPQDRDVEVIAIDGDQATFRPVRGLSQETFTVPCAEALNWQYLGKV